MNWIGVGFEVRESIGLEAALKGVESEVKSKGEGAEGAWPTDYGPEPPRLTPEPGAPTFSVVGVVWAYRV